MASWSGPTNVPNHYLTKNEVLGTWSLVMVVLGLLPLVHLLVDMLDSFGFCGRDGLAKLRLVEQGLITL